MVTIGYESTVGTVPDGVHDSLGLSFFGKVKNLLATYSIFQENGTSGSKSERNGGVNVYTELASLNLTHGIASETGKLVLL